MTEKYDVIVVGGGHAGCEAAAATANLGSRTLLITMDMGKFAQMSCNPAMGGVAKGQIIREIDALAGYSGIVSDYSAIQFRMLNRSKGPAMWSPRTQNDRQLFTTKWREMLEQTPNLDFWQDSVTALISDGQTVTGVHTSLGIKFNSTCVILTSGTFMNGLIHVGNNILGGGRMGEKASTGITAQLETFGFESGRMKTGTPPRIDGSSLDYTKMEEQHGDINPQTFSFLPGNVLKNQASCHITYTNQTVHDIIGSSLSQSPLYNGQISGIGPRYCPSVEDKVQRFADKDRHQIFVEPEGWNTKEVYVNGFSTSLPLDVQTEAIRHIPGFKNAKMFRPGYAIEYDYFPPTQLSLSLETKLLSGLFFAGQINGTTGYEEAASQGLIAGINAHQKCVEKEPIILSRKDAYIGVLIDDLITKGTEEPYRMFTSRAEYRINLRHMTADERLTPLSFNLGLADKQRIKKLDKKLLQKTQYSKLLSKTSIQPDEANPVLESISSRPIQQAVKATSLITRPNISATLLNEISPLISHFCQTQNISKEAIESAEIEIKYSGYILREQEQAEKMLNMDRMRIPLKFKYESLKSISNESKEKLLRVNPDNLGQASRIPGVKPSDISILMVAIDSHVSHET
jgi:tRNA uridine 5-carboxymethylaminomethyl modification enzyme